MVNRLINAIFDQYPETGHGPQDYQEERNKPDMVDKAEGSISKYFVDEVIIPVVNYVRKPRHFVDEVITPVINYFRKPRHPVADTQQHTANIATVVRDDKVQQKQDRI